MDTSQYLPMFLAEAREHLQELNLAVVRIEEQPDDRATVDEIFRIAHSLKGMSATMGFEGMAALTHHMEDVFELLRQRSGGLDQAAVDVLFECLDALSGAIDAIDGDGDERLSPEALIARLTALVRSDGESESEQAAEITPAELAERAGGRRAVHVAVQLAPDALMPSVRAYQALVALGDIGEVLRSVPAEIALESFAGRTLEVWLATELEHDAIVRTALSVADVAGAEIAEADLEAAAAEPDPAGEEAAALAAPAEPGPAGAEAAEAEPAEAEPEVAATHRRATSTTIRVDAERLDQLMHYMGELVVHRTLVESLAAEAEVPGLVHAMQELTRSSQALQAMVMQVRMIPVEAVFLRMPRLVRDLSSRLGKHVELKLVGQDTELDRTVVEALGDPLVHLVRNSLDHGLEPGDERRAAGKPEAGTLEISARHAGGSVVIEVRDDGRGIDPARIAAKAVERGLITAEAAAALDVSRAAELLFAPGFSTAEQTSDISGRGVGMDAVRTAIRELGGEVVLSSELGRGTTAQIRLPLTLAIMAALLVEVGGEPFAIPLDRVEHTLRLSDNTVRSVAGQRMLVLRDGVLPLLDGADTLSAPDAAERDHAVIVRAGDRRLALAVTSLVGQRELVTRALPGDLGERAAVSGGAVLSNGRIALIVDCDSLSAAAVEHPASIA